MHTINDSPLIGVGLRHSHYVDAIQSQENIDFLEIHAENFFADGGATLAVLDAVRQRYPISIHATALSLGSHCGLSQTHLLKLKRLVDRVDPILVSDHACFAAAQFNGKPIHAGDLLPIAFNEASLSTLVNNIQQVQSTLNRSILIENLSAYLTLPDQTLSETEFLVAACKRSGCGLLLDVNNLAVNAKNEKSQDILKTVSHWMEQIPVKLVGEIHLAGCTEVPSDIIMVDDHSQPVPEDVWQAYRYAVARFGQTPTLIEWDTQLPDWSILTAEADKARTINIQTLSESTEKQEKIT